MPLEIEDWIELFAEALEHYKKKLDAIKQSKELVELSLEDSDLGDIQEQKEEINRLIKHLKGYASLSLGEATDGDKRSLLKTALVQYEEDLGGAMRTYNSKLPKAKPNFKKLKQEIVRIQQCLGDDVLKAVTLP